MSAACLGSPHLGALGTSEKKQLGVLPGRRVGHTLRSAVMGLGIEAVEPSNSSNEPLFELLEPEYPMYAGNPLPKHTGDLPT